MGNTCCVNDAIREENGFAYQVELKKPSKKVVKEGKYRSINNVSTAPNSTTFQPTPQNIEKWSLNEEYKNFLEKFREIRTKINQTVNSQKSLLSKKKWQESLEPFDKYYLTLSDRYELTKLLYKILKVEFNRPFTQQEIDEEFLQKIDQMDMSEEIGYKLKSLKQKIKHRKVQALQHLDFMKQFSTYNADFSDIKKIARRVHEFCKNDINSFSFITLYLIHCTNQQLNKNPSSLFEIIDQLKTILNELSIEYPPSSVQRQEEQEIAEQHTQGQTIDVTYQTCIRYPMIKFTSDDAEQKARQIQAYITQKAREAKKDKINFQNILRPVCMKRGSHFQSALKIRSNSDEEILSVVRTIEKIVFKGHEDECQRQIENMKQQMLEQLQETEEYNKLDAFVDKWTESIEQAERKILDGKRSIPFNVGDLLRAKAMFKSRGDITKTVKDIEHSLDKWPKDKYSILQTEDRLDTPTKDFKMLLQIGDTIAELQLAKEMNKASNEFNHKIYELKRSKAFTPLFNLLIINERLSEIFFTDLLEFLFIMIDFQQPEFLGGQQSLQNFTTDYLSKNVQIYKDSRDEYDAQNRLFTKDQATIKEQTEEKLDIISQMLKLGYSINGYYERDDIRRSNQQNFMR